MQIKPEPLTQLASKLNHVQPAMHHPSTSSSSPTVDPDVIMKESLPQLTPISTSKKAQARFATALVDLAAPAFATVTSIVLPYLSSLMATASASASSLTTLPVIQLPLVVQPCAEACVPLTINPLAPPLHPSLDLSIHNHGSAQPTPKTPKPNRKGKFMPAPDFVHAERAWDTLASLLKPKRLKDERPFKCGATTHRRLTRMLILLRIYTHPDTHEHMPWVAASLHVAKICHRKPATAEQLCIWTQNWVHDHHIPVNKYGTWSLSMLNDGDLAQSIHEHLQELGVYRKAEDVVWYLAMPLVQKDFNLKKGISLATAQRWMKTMKYWWRRGLNGRMLYSCPISPLLTVYRAICGWSQARRCR
jgi:hypothetical protein